MSESEDAKAVDDLAGALAAIDELIADGELEQAEEAIDEAVAKYGDDGELLVLRAEVALESDEYEECLFAVDDALGKVDDEQVRSQLLELKGYANFYGGELEEARRAFNEAIRLGGARWTGLLGRALVHEEMFYFQASLLDLERAIELDDQEAQPFAVRGSIEMQQGNLDAAQGDLEHAVELDPDDEESRLSLARLQAVARKTSAAMETLEPLVEDGQDPELVKPAALLRSQLSLTLGSFEAAAEDAQLAIEVAPDEPWGYLQLAACQLTAMKPGDAVAAIKEAEDRVDDVRDIPDVFSLRASAYDQLDKPEKAAEMRQKAEGAARLPGVVYGEILNPARNIPLNPNKPVDARTLMSQIFDDPSQAPEGYEDALREVIAQIPQMIDENPDAGQIRIQLPELEGMDKAPQSLVLQVKKGGQRG